MKVSFTTVIDKWVHALVLTNNFTALSLIVSRKNETLNYNEQKYYFNHRNLGHIKLGYYER